LRLRLNRVSLAQDDDRTARERDDERRCHGQAPGAAFYRVLELHSDRSFKRVDLKKVW
jgi:hypothetical protein